MPESLLLEQLLCGVAESCHERDFEWAATQLSKYDFRATPAEVVDHAAECVSLSWGAFRGPYRFVRELSLLLEDETGTRFRGVKDGELPSVIVDHLFKAAVSAAEEALQGRKWAKADALLRLLVALPGASNKRAETIVEIAGRQVGHARCIQSGILSECGNSKRRLRGSEWAVFRINLSLPVAASQSAGYPDLADVIITELLAEAEWPTLMAIDPQTVALLWPELTSLDQRKAVRLTPAAREWLRRVICLDPEDEQYSADELHDPES